MKYDIIGDIHGCYDEFLSLIRKLGYSMRNGIPLHPDHRQLAFVGDAMDRGPNSLKILNLLFEIQDAGTLFYSPGNHCNKLYRFAKGNHVQLAHGLETTVAELNTFSKEKRKHFLNRYRQFYEALPYYHTMNNGNLIVVHAGIREEMIGAPYSEEIRVFVLYGDITGGKLPDGRPIRRDWATHYKGDAFIVYGHTPVEKARFVNNTVNIDTGCVFGGKLMALRYPELEVVSVPSLQPFIPEKFTQFD
ncbi:bis(5'-nucleosyl)-tetraphosphatase PrpE [Sporosarcina limicola]|uniref:Diadenosine tetraphosphatase ApaH/serine/threonine PP2A family protein phosphatase n=1 Tax=Sporosarcina limicola TaxID=34101 RepID=A0A927RF47_9BACL|nr:bis(5'-nucleosyl)-tetraphosphatase PrpE [Sporosarcina limicola]MBE1556935.1 diadenosine tetraphosphatase ApaH/serine/threonine PP2A family protein phosphatase [Sporosarcina limicola]